MPVMDAPRVAMGARAGCPRKRQDRIWRTPTAVPPMLRLRSRQPTASRGARPRPTWERMLDAAGVTAGELDPYVHRSAAANTCATGRRSVAVTSSHLREFAARRLGEDQLQPRRGQPVGGPALLEPSANDAARR